MGKKPVNGGINSENRILAVPALDKGLSRPNLLALDRNRRRQYVELHRAFLNGPENYKDQ